MATIPFFANPLTPIGINTGTRINGAGGGGASGGMSGDAQARAQAARERLFELAEGRLGELRNDEVDQMVLSSLRERTGAGAGPYDAATVNAIRTGAAEQAGQVERNALARVTGGAGDPSTQSQIAEAGAARQAAIQRANLDISQRANVANYDARGQALGQTAGFNANRNQAITGQTNNVAGLVAAEEFKDVGQPASGPQPGPGQPAYPTMRRPQARPTNRFGA